MLVGKDAKVAPAPFDVPKEVLGLNPHEKAEIVNIPMPYNPGVAIHPHWLRRDNAVDLIYPVYVFFHQPVAQLEADDRLHDPTVEKKFGNAYGMYRADDR